MNPYDLGSDAFRTQADVNSTSFTNPMNAVNMNRGRWGIDANYLTPAFMSPYRPEYAGPGRADPYAFNPSWIRSAREMAGLNFYSDNYGGNAYNQLSPNHTKFITGPIDLAAAAAQRVAMPLAAGYMATRFLSTPGMNFGRGVGQGFGASVARSFGASGASAAMAARAGGAVGGMLGSVMLPALAAQGMVSLADDTLFDPYLAMRQGSNNFRNNFQGYTFGGGYGNSVTGGGLSNKQAAGMASKITQAGIKDFTFNVHEINQISDMSMRSGLLDNVNPDQFVKKIESITKQVKVVMALANSSDIRESIELLSKLNTSGALHSKSIGTLASVAGMSAIGGISTQQMMNTVGAQGQYMFQAAGMTPYVGQMVASQNYASFAAAARNGLISPTMLARMGGTEGATQSATGGMVGLLSSPYAAMYGMNKYFSGGDRGNIVGNVSRFGGNIAGNPLEAIGNFNLTRPALMSRMAEDGGMQTAVDFVAQLANETPGAKTGKNGTISSGAAYMMLTRSYGLQDDQARALLNQLRAYQDDGTVSQMNQGLRKTEKETMLNYYRNNNMNMGIFSRPYNNVVGFYKDAKSRPASNIGSILRGVGGMTDDLESWWFNTRYGDMDKQSSWSAATTDTLLNEKSSISEGPLELGRNAKGLLAQMFDRGSIKTSKEKINELAKQGNKTAIAAIKGSGIERINALDKLAQDGHIDEAFKDRGRLNDLVADIDASGTQAYTGGNKNAAYLGKAYEGVLRNADVFQANKFMDNMASLRSMIKDGRQGSDAWKSQVSQVEKTLGKSNLSDPEIRELVDNYNKNVTASGIYLQEGVFKEAGIDQDAASAAFKSGKGEQFARSNLKGAALDSFLKSDKSDKSFALAVSQSLGKNFKGATVDYSKNPYADPNEAFTGVAETSKALNDARSKIHKLHEDRRIDTSTAFAMENQLDYKEAVGDFSKAVDKFEKAVGGISSGDGKPSAPQLPGESSGFMRYWK